MYFGDLSHCAMIRGSIVFTNDQYLFAASLVTGENENMTHLLGNSPSQNWENHEAGMKTKGTKKRTKAVASNSFDLVCPSPPMQPC